jgi:hypothetical protein
MKSWKEASRELHSSPPKQQNTINTTNIMTTTPPIANMNMTPTLGELTRIVLQMQNQLVITNDLLKEHKKESAKSIKNLKQQIVEIGNYLFDEKAEHQAEFPDSRNLASI